MRKPPRKNVYQLIFSRRGVTLVFSAWLVTPRSGPSRYRRLNSRPSRFTRTFGDVPPFVPASRALPETGGTFAGGRKHLLEAPPPFAGTLLSFFVSICKSIDEKFVLPFCVNRSRCSRYAAGIRSAARRNSRRAALRRIFFIEGYISQFDISAREVPGKYLSVK